VPVTYVKDHRLVEEQIETAADLEAYFRERVPEDELHKAEVLSIEPEGPRVKITEKATGSARTSVFPVALFQSQGYRSLKAAHVRLLEAAGPPPFTARMNKRTEPVHTFEQVRPVILDLAKEGLNLQRFKGLGEMNPEQLWDTTMNPENRVLQQVGVEDAAAADEMFSMLMGDRVEPRRDFIERNARDVKFLDV
jgi:DNA gyrase subunit B